MATYYVDSSATGSNNGSSKANAFTSFYTAVSSSASGDILLVSHTHSEQYTGFGNLEMDQRRAISINFSDDSYTFGAKIYSTSSGTPNNLQYNEGIFYGMEFDCLSRDLYLTHVYAYDCKFDTGNDTFHGKIFVGFNGKLTTFKKCRFSFKTTAGFGRQSFITFGTKPFIRFEDCSLDSGSVALPNFFNNLYGGLDDGARVEINGFDLSNASADLIFNNTNSLSRRESVKVNNIKLPASWPNVNGTLIGSFSEYIYPGWAGNSSFSAVDDPLNGFTYEDYIGSITDDSTIYRTATTGTTNYSLKYVTITTAAPGSMLPADSLQYVVSTFFSRANPTITVHAFGDHATILTDQEFWIEVEYPLSGGVRGFSSTLHSNLIMGTGTNVTATGSASDWTGESGSNQRFYNPSITISDGEPGIYRVKVYLARASETLYVDPRVDIT